MYLLNFYVKANWSQCVIMEVITMYSVTLKWRKHFVSMTIEILRLYRGKGDAVQAICGGLS